MSSLSCTDTTSEHSTFSSCVTPLAKSSLRLRPSFFFEENESKNWLLERDPKYKTEICKNFRFRGECQWGDACSFAHGETELRQKVVSPLYKTLPCKQFFDNSFCTYGTRCQYFHDAESFSSAKNKLVYRLSTLIEDNSKTPLSELLNSGTSKSLPKLSVFVGLSARLHSFSE